MTGDAGQAPDAVCIHAYYPDVFELILDRLTSTGVSCEIFVSTTEDREREIGAILNRSGLDVRVLIVENHGMDTLAFVKTVAEFDLHRRRHVLKLHTKNPSDRGRVHLAVMLDGVIGDGELVGAIAAAFTANDRLYQVGPELLYRPTELFAHRNRRTLERIRNAAHGDYRSEKEVFTKGFFVGSTFWTRGAALAPLVGIADRLDTWSLLEPASMLATGADGLIAHALERSWLEIFADRDVGIGLVRPRLEASGGYAIRVANAEEAAGEPFRRRSGGGLIERTAMVRDDHEVIGTSGSFAEDWYRRTYGDQIPADFSPLEHFLLHGEIVGANPNPGFQTAYHRLKNRTPPKLNVFAAKLRVSAERVVAPTPRQWLSLARDIGVYDPGWYAAEYRDVEPSRLGADDHMLEFGLGWRRQGALGYDPQQGEGGLLDYLQADALEDRDWHERAMQMLETDDYRGAMRLLDMIIKNWGANGPLLAALALCHAWEERWDEVAALMKEHRTQSRISWPSWRFETTLIRDALHPHARFEPVESKPDRPARACVYTSVFDDRPPPPQVRVEGVDLLCLSDQPIDAPGWRVVATPRPHETPSMSETCCKLFPYWFLPDYQASLHVDYDLISCLTEDAVLAALTGDRFAIGRRAGRTDLMRDLIARLGDTATDPADNIAQIRRYLAEGAPKETPVFDHAMIWRSHVDHSVKAVMEAAWRDVEAQEGDLGPALAVAIQRAGVRPKLLPDRMGGTAG